MAIKYKSKENRYSDMKVTNRIKNKIKQSVEMFTKRHPGSVNVILHGKTDFTDVIKLMTFRWGGDPRRTR